jgi:hypothetical protein
MHNLQLPDGRTILLERLEIRCTYDGHREGSYVSVSEYVLEELAAQAEHASLQVIASTSPLPAYRCDARFSSDAFAPDDHNLRTVLTVVWFTDRVPEVFADLFRQVIPAIQWRQHAVEYDPYDF